MSFMKCALLCFITVYYTFAFGELIWEKQEIEVRPSTLVEKVNAKFYFTNIGSQTITISNIQTSCGCTTASLEKKNYKPGESGFIAAEFEIGSRIGFQQKHILVATDSTNQAYTQLTLKVYLPEVLKIEPGLLQWKIGETNELRKITLTATGVVPIKVIGVESTHEWIDAELKIKESGKLYEIEVTPLKLNEPIEASLKIQTLVDTNLATRWFFVKVSVK